MRSRNLPADAPKSLYQHIAPPLIQASQLPHRILRSEQSRRCRILHCTEHGAVRLRMIMLQGSNDRSVAGGEAEPPACHVVGFGHSIGFNSIGFAVRMLKQAKRLVAVEAERAIGKIIQHRELIAGGKLQRPFPEFPVATAPVGLLG